MTEKTYIVRAKKIVTVSDIGTIYDGAFAVTNGKIVAIGKWVDIRKQFQHVSVKDYSRYIITPSLVDCHTHLLEFAPSGLYPITSATQQLAGMAILLEALTSGITAIGEQVCGHPDSNYSMADFKRIVKYVPIDCTFSATSVSIGFENLAHFSAITKNKQIERDELYNPNLIQQIAELSDYPGENLFINATPANFTKDLVPRAGEIIYSLEQLQQFVQIFHNKGKKIGVHVGGKAGIDLALRAGVDVLHHAHEITEEQVKKASEQGVKVVATPLGGTHLSPNSPENIVSLVTNNIEVSIATDAYLPPFPNVHWLPFTDQGLRGSNVLMKIAAPAMKLLNDHDYDENDILALITKNPATLLQKGNNFGSLAKQTDANFLVASGIPGLEIDDVEEIKSVYFRGEEVVNRMN